MYTKIQWNKKTLYTGMCTPKYVNRQPKYEAEMNCWYQISSSNKSSDCPAAPVSMFHSTLEKSSSNNFGALYVLELYVEQTLTAMVKINTAY